MTTTDVIAPGEAALPSDIPGGVLAGIDPGRWVAERGLGPGASYQVTSYSPHPSAAQLSHAGRAYPWTALAPDLSLTIPVRGSLEEQYPEAIFGPFHAPTRTRLQQGGVPEPGPSIGDTDGGLALRGRLPARPAPRRRVKDALRVRRERAALPTRTATPTTRTHP